MGCPYCRSGKTKVVNSRVTPQGDMVRRRRECRECHRRFTTFEMIEKIPLVVIKQDGRREAFDRQKIINGIVKACEKRTVNIVQIEKLVSEVEKELYNQMEKEVKSQQIGEMVLTRLRELDEVAYVRFASVYRNFRDVSEFTQELQTLLKRQEE
ncbi:transcriptional repressor NrdR [Candidatus Sumerlaeota bacterium]|nr:transcriptional repressor NrdR [Candidatus Sumerlaeota bacterium]